MSKFRWLLALLCVAAAVPGSASAQQRGVITGRVVAEGTNQALTGATVTVSGTNLGATTDQQGNYRIQNVPAGTYDVVASALSHTNGTQRVSVAAGGTATANFALSTSAVEIGGLVVTATGETARRREIGATVARINEESVNLAVNRDLNQILAGRVAGVNVLQTAGTVGTGAKIRIRGSNSLSLQNEPLLIVDGVRVSNDASGFGIGLSGQTTSRFSDINPEDIENIDIIKGPAGVALYGTAAANGVIYITTKRGRAGRTQWNSYVEMGRNQQETEFPLNYAQIGTLTQLGGGPAHAGKRFTNCNIDNQARGICVAGDSLATFSPLATFNPFRRGDRRAFGVSASGGGEQATYYLSGDFEEEEGVVADNDQDRVNLRANVTGQLASTLRATVTTGYLSSRTRLPFGDNTSFGAVPNGTRGRAFECSPARPCIRGVGTSAADLAAGRAVFDSTSLGFGIGYPPSEFQFIRNRQDLERFIGGVTTAWTPLAWLQVTGQGGMDINNAFDHQLIAPGVSDFSPTILEGSRTGIRRQNRQYSGSVTGTANYGLTTDLNGSTTLGTQYINESVNSITATGAALVIGTESLAGASARYSVGEVNQEVITVGVYGQQTLDWRDRLFLVAGVRADDNSAFGQEFDLAVYPSASLSWVLSEEPFFPAQDFLGNLRLRAAYGQSGQRPGFRQAETFFSGVTGRVANLDVPALIVGGTGNPNLKPEQSEEFEFGFDAGLLNDRVGVEVTRYDKTTRNVLVQRVLAPSVGLSRLRFENLGEMTNKGWEFVLRATPIQSSTVTWDGTLTYSTNSNRVVELGENVAPILFNFDNVQRHQAGYPAGSYFSRRLVSYKDNNSDGVIGRDELVLSDTAEFHGTPFAGKMASLNTGISFFDLFRVTSQFDYQGDRILFNSSEEFRCAFIQNCRGIQDRNAPQAEQAAAIGRLLGSFTGYFQDASFVKWRELALTFSTPADWSRRFGMSETSITLAGRNLKTWSPYGGFDPEVNSTATGNFTIADFDAAPPVQTWSVRVNARF